jgi:hypothetical protein
MTTWTLPIFTTVAISLLFIAGCQGQVDDTGDSQSRCECKAPPTASEVAKALLELPEFKQMREGANAEDGGSAPGSADGGSAPGSADGGSAPGSADVRTPEAFAACVANLKAPGKVNVYAGRAFRRIHACARPPKPQK